MGSQRLPGKVLRTMNGHPMLAMMLESIKRCRWGQSIIVATSTSRKDDPIRNYCLQERIKVYSGPEENVAGRFQELLLKLDGTAFVRLCADSPLIDYRLIDQAIVKFEEGNWDIVTNVFPRTFPHGQSVELVRSDIYLDQYPKFFKQAHYEHVTTYFYQFADQFSIFNLDSKQLHRKLSLAVDTIDDFSRIEDIVKMMVKPTWSYTVDDIVALSHSNPYLSKNDGIEQKNYE